MTRRPYVSGATVGDWSLKFMVLLIHQYASARALANRHESPDHRWFKRSDELIDRYPRLERSFWHLSYQAQELWMRHIGWRLER